MRTPPISTKRLLKLADQSGHIADQDSARYFDLLSAFSSEAIFYTANWSDPEANRLPDLTVEEWRARLSRS